MSDEQIPLFRVSNHHVEDCGVPPAIDGDRPNTYHSYFENEHGEQAIFTFDHQTKQGIIVLGDAGWEKSYPVEDGRAAGLVLDPAEQFWLVACWKAATGQRDITAVFQRALERKDAEIKRIKAAMQEDP